MIAVAHNKTETVACDVCGSVDQQDLWSLAFETYPGPFNLRRCRDCGLVFNWPQLPADAIRGQYNGDYYVFKTPPEQRWARMTQLYIEHLLVAERQCSGRRLLEIGCAEGDLLNLACMRGWDVSGVELSADAARSAVTEYGLDVRAGTIDQHADGLGEFDAVIATDVIEHVPSPSRFLQRIRRLLRPDGRAIIVTPNFGGFWRRLAGRQWIGLNRFHIYLFDAGCLTRLMRQVGFGDLSVSSYTNASYVEWGQRPELARITNHLPGPLRWRMERLLNGLTPPSLARDLHRNPPSSPAKALARIALAEQDRPAGRGLSQPLGDNLTIVARV